MKLVEFRRAIVGKVFGQGPSVYVNPAWVTSVVPNPAEQCMVFINLAGAPAEQVWGFPEGVAQELAGDGLTRMSAESVARFPTTRIAPEPAAADESARYVRIDTFELTDDPPGTEGYRRYSAL